MNGQTAMDEIVTGYARHLREKSRDVAELAGQWSSFEGWLKGEFCLMARRLPVSGASPDERRVGAEYSARLSGGDRTKEQKRVDAWVTVAAKEHIYVELKVAFKNDNLATQLARWRADAAALRRLDDTYEEAVGAAAILIGVGLPAVDEDAGVEVAAKPRVALWATTIQFTARRGVS